MNLFERIAKGFGYTKANQPMPGWLLAGAGSEQFRIPDGSLWESQARLYQQLSWVQIAVSIVAQSCATTAFGVKQLDIQVFHFIKVYCRIPIPLIERDFVRTTERAEANHPFEVIAVERTTNSSTYTNVICFIWHYDLLRHQFNE